jgi:hypothetical protein
MADLKRWFKVWTAILNDPHHAELSLADAGRWLRLGAMTALVGHSGVLAVHGAGRRLLEVLEVNEMAEAKQTLARLPNIVLSDAPVRWPHGSAKSPLTAGVAWCKGAVLPGVNSRGSNSFEEWCSRNGDFYITWKNWKKYQEDTTAAARGRALRFKRRGEEKRQEEIRREEKKHAPAPPADQPEFKINDEIQAALRQAPRLGAVARLWSVEFWRAEVRANGDLDLPAEILNAEAWMAANPRKAPRKDLPRFLHNWLSRTERPDS